MANFKITDELRRGSRILRIDQTDTSVNLSQLSCDFQIQDYGDFILSFDVKVDDINQLNSDYYFIINDTKLYLLDYIMLEDWDTVRYKFKVNNYVEYGKFLLHVGNTTSLDITNISLIKSGVYIGWTPSCQDMLGKPFYTKVQIIGESNFVYKDNFNEFVGPALIRLTGNIESVDIGTYIWQIQTASQDWVNIYNGRTNQPIVPLNIYPTDEELIRSYPKLKDKGRLWNNGNLDVRLCYEHEQEFYFYLKSMHKISSSSHVATATVKSSNGNIFKPGMNTETFLTAELYYNGELVKRDDNRFVYYWEKFDKNGLPLIKYSDDFEVILAKGEVEFPHKPQILINVDDVFMKNIFNCKVARILNT